MTMKPTLSALFVLGFALCAFTSSAKEKQRLPLPATVLTAKSVFIDNQTGMAKLGDRAYEELKKWGRFQIVQDQKKADLFILLSTEPPRGGNLILSGGQTGTLDSEGRIEEDRVPNYNKQAPVRYAFLTVIEAQTPRDAERLAGNNGAEIHLLLTDVVMPGMSGRELAKRLTERYPNLRVLYMSGYTYNVIARDGTLEEGISFLQKPFTPQVLAERVREALDRPVSAKI